MNKLCLLACLLLPFAATAQTAPRVVFVGENVTASWQTSTEFTANKNWIGEGIVINSPSGSGEVLQNFQSSVINQHPAYVHIMVGYADTEYPSIKDSTPLGVVFAGWQSSIVAMVTEATQAHIKVILGNILSLPAVSIVQDPNAISFMNAWLDQYGRANNIPVVNYAAAFCGCTGPGFFGGESSATLAPYFTPQGNLSDAGAALLTQMAQIAIATNGLTIRRGYLSNLLLLDVNVPQGPTPQVNKVIEGSILDFTAQAQWSDGVVRPMLNLDYDGMNGIWTSSNPAVMYISQQGQAMAIGAGTTTISFRSASGIPFSPWIMTVLPESCNC